MMGWAPNLHLTKTPYISSQRCRAENLGCLFLPPSRCAHYMNLTSLPRTRARRCVYENINERSFSNGVSFFFNTSLAARARINRVYSDHWYMKEVYLYALRPNKELLQFMSRLQSEIGAMELGKTISVHIRHGDHWMGKHHAAEQYARVAKRVANVVGAHSVLLGSDDFRALEEFQKHLPDLRVLPVPMNYSVLGSHEEKCSGRSKKCHAARLVRKHNLLNFSSTSIIATQVHDEGQLVVSQALLMAKTSVVIGTLSSNLGRIMHQLAWANQIRQLGRKTPSAPSLSYFDMNGDQYFACGWRKSAHHEVDLDRYLDKWEKHYKYLHSRLD